jgi:hypothetical protein
VLSASGCDQLQMKIDIDEPGDIFCPVYRAIK